jgi:hypothetical protein
MKTLMTVKRELVTEGETSDKQSPQAVTIVNTIIAKVGLGNPIDRAALVAELESAGTLNTRQDVGRVVSYYQPRLQEAGLLEVTKESEASDGEKPAKASKGTSKKGDAAPAKAEAAAS